MQKWYSIKKNLRKNNIKFLRDNDDNVGCNGKNYISVCKRLNPKGYAYIRFIENNCAFIINPNIKKINSIKETKEIKRNILINKIIGPKHIEQEKIIVNSTDEYLIKDKIPFDDIIGLKLPYFYDENELLTLIKFLENTKHNLPIIDVEREIQFNKEKVKQLIR